MTYDDFQRIISPGPMFWWGAVFCVAAFVLAVVAFRVGSEVFAGLGVFVAFMGLSAFLYSAVTMDSDISGSVADEAYSQGFVVKQLSDKDVQMLSDKKTVVWGGFTLDGKKVVVVVDFDENNRLDVREGAK